MGLLPHDAGEIRWNGELVDDPANFFIPPRTAYTSQVPHLFSYTLKENLLLGIPEENADVEESIRFAVLDKDLADLPDGLDTQVGPRGQTFRWGKCNVVPPHACLSVIQNYLFLMICRAH